MIQKKPHVDAVVVGFGWTGAILAKELTEAGLKVVALERGEYRDTYPGTAHTPTQSTSSRTTSARSSSWIFQRPRSRSATA
ncbi:choline dehydrogenase-like flavoprotein [Paraburkholderia youngii]